jgi:WhiB family redox-sensing transcriptional regulator
VTAEITHPFDDIPPPGPWSAAAACRDAPTTDPWFPGPGRNATAAARAICETCPVRIECLSYAVGWKINFGIWGGRDVEERKKIRRRRSLVAT